MINILKIDYFPPAGLLIIIEPTILCLIFLVLILFFIFIWFIRKKLVNNWRVEEADIKFGEIGNVKIKPNYDVSRISHQAWVEMQTRKVALPFDEDDDFIIEIYNSWYQMFGEFRHLIKTIPAELIRSNQDTAELVNTMVDVLNKGLRPHLTKWQARFRSWHENDCEETNRKCPQDLQKNFPDYQALVSDLKLVNQGLIEYSNYLQRLAHGNNIK